LFENTILSLTPHPAPFFFLPIANTILATPVLPFPTIYCSHPLYQPLPSSPSIAAILSLLAINPLSPHSPFPTIPASLTVKPYLTPSLALLYRGAENLFIYEFVRHKGRRELEKNWQKPNWKM
jgi:hypothetical protein